MGAVSQQFADGQPRPLIGDDAGFIGEQPTCQRLGRRWCRLLGVFFWAGTTRQALSLYLATRARRRTDSSRACDQSPCFNQHLGYFAAHYSTILACAPGALKQGRHIRLVGHTRLLKHEPAALTTCSRLELLHASLTYEQPTCQGKRCSFLQAVCSSGGIILAFCAIATPNTERRCRTSE